MNQIVFLEITWLMLIVQSLGLCFLAISFQQNTNRRIVGFQIAGICFCIIFYALAGESTPVALNSLAVMRNIVFIFRPSKWATHKAWAFVFSSLFIAAGILTYESPIDLLPTAGMVFSTISVYCINPKATRLWALCTQAGWLTFNSVKLLIPTLVGDIVIMTSNVSALIRYDLGKKKSRCIQ